MRHYDNTIEMFDAYLNGTMSDSDKSELEGRLAHDSDLNRQLLMHKEMIYGLQQACGEADQELGQALKMIGDDEFNTIVGRNRRDNAATTGQASGQRARVVPIKQLRRWLSVAAMVIIIAGVGVGHYVKTQSRYQACDAIYATGFNADNLISAARDAGQMSQATAKLNDAISMIDKSPRQAAQQLQAIFDSQDDDAQEIKVDCGIALAYAQVKAHDVDKARKTIQMVKQHNDGMLPEELENLQRALDQL